MLPDGVPRTSFGPRLHAALSVLTGAYRLSKRQVVQLGSDLLGLTISVGMISKLERVTAEVLEQPVAELAEASLGRMARVIGGGTFSRRSPYASWFEDVRALGFLRPPWGLAYDNLFATSFG